MTAYLAISSLLNFLAASLLSFAVMVRGRQEGLNLRFGLFAVSIGAWSAAYFFWQVSDEAVRALFFARLLMVFASFVPVTFFHFIVDLCGEDRRHWVRGGYLVALILAVLNFTPLMITGVEPAMQFPFWPQAGPFYWLYLGFFTVLTYQAGRLLLDTLRQSVGARAAQLRNILIASIVGFGGGATNFPLWYDVPLPPFGNLLIFVYLLIMAHAVSRYQLPLVAHDFVHAAVYLGLSVTLSVIYLLGLTSLGSLLNVQFSNADLFAQFFGSLIVCWVFFWGVPKLHKLADLILAQTYSRRRHNQQKQLKELAARIGSIGSEKEIFEHLAPEIVRAFNLQATAIYVRTEFDRDYQLRAMQGWSHCPPHLPINSELTRVFQNSKSPVLFDGSEMEFAVESVEQLEEFREKIPFDAIFPIASDDFLSGVLLLGHRAENERYTEAELTLLESICLQIAVTLRARQLERRASQTDKLIALGTLAAGLAHELRNPLTSIQTFAALLREQTPEPEALKEFGAVVQRDVTRIASIVENVAAFAESNKVTMTTVKLPEVLQTVVEIIRPEAERHGVTLTFKPTMVPHIMGNNSQLLQVFLNLAQNAIQAMDQRPGSELVLDISLRTTDVPRPQLCAAVIDNGPGVDPELLPHIFEPFTTTKATGQRRGKHGMGLGLAIVKRIVQHHHGEIQVTSQLDQGTTFRVYLPVQP